MDKGLARGYARTYLRNVQAWRPVADAFAVKARRDGLFKAIDDAAFKSKPARAMKRIRALMPKGCSTPSLTVKRRGLAIVSAAIIGRVQRNAIFAPGAEECAFHEASVEMARVIMMGNAIERDISINATATISKHAIQRLLQREASTPETLAADMREILHLADHVHWRLLGSSLDEELRDHALLIPFRGGALVATYVAHDPTGGRGLPDGPIWVMSIRTFLAPEMLGCEEWRRMAPMEREIQGLEVSQMTGIYYEDPVRNDEELHEDWRDLLRINAEPRDLRALDVSDAEPETSPAEASELKAA